MNSKTAMTALALPLAAAAVLATAPAASASGGGGGVRASGSCSGTSHWTLKAKADNGRLEVEFQVDTNRVGRSWNVHITDNGTGIFTGTRVTQAPSGSFTVRKLTANRAGVDHLVATARNAASGEMCTAKLAV